MKNEALQIISSAIKAADPYINTKKLLEELFPEKKSITVFSIGKAAVPMAKAAADFFGDKIRQGLSVTKYFHSEGFSSPYFEVIEASHPISDENSIKAAEKALEIAHKLNRNDILLVLLSGGGSALFEKSIISPELQQDITKRLLSRGASIEEINAVRKRLSLVKGGRLAAAAYPARVITIALSDVLGNDKGVIASGITTKNTDTDSFVKECTDKYLPDIPEETKKLLLHSEEININDGGYYFAGDISILCDAAEKRGRELGFTVHSCNRKLQGEARDEAKSLIASIPSEKGRHLYVFGGETVVTLKGDGKGGRNQEMALSAAICLKDKKGIAFASAGSDGTDGPTDAAGGFADTQSFEKMKSLSIDPITELDNNNSYYALEKSGLLIKTGPTGTNVNDITIILTENYEN